MTKMPAPMMAPTPRAVSCSTPSVRFRLCSPPSLDSSRSTFSDFRASKLAMVFVLLILLFGEFAPDEIDRRAQQNDDQPRPGVVRLVNQQQDFNQAGSENVDGRQDRISERLVGSLHLRPGAAQGENSGNRQDVEQ